LRIFVFEEKLSDTAQIGASHSNRVRSYLSQRSHEDVVSNIRSNKYSRREKLLRVLWFVGLIIFRMTPRPLFGLRRSLLRLFGADIGLGVRTYPSTHIYFPWNLRVGAYSSFGEQVLVYNLGIVQIGERVTVSQRAHLCAGSHDYRIPSMPLLKPPIRVEDDVWICADAYIGPGICVGSSAIVGARAVVVRDVEPSTVVGGNPAKFIKYREESAGI
jgi:putative colanic acid biosynthesis acetyltransferase WcaF